MILRYLPLIVTAPAAFAILIAAFGCSMLVGLIFHEYCHAVVADRLGEAGEILRMPIRRSH